jgi:tRNA-dihydrouridine synthase A
MLDEHVFSVAPMLDWTDRHFRYLCRLMSRQALLYTEMITTKALIFGERDRFLRYEDLEHPIALQLGGSDAAELVQCSKMAEQQGFDEINLNIGCPSERVQSGSFGACLMAEPNLIAESIAAMVNSVSVPISIKTRIGIDHRDSYEFLMDFVSKTSEAGCHKYIIHARKAWLKGLNPKQNRDIPSLDYKRAGSSTSGLFVAAITIMPSVPSKPSISTNNWFNVCSRSS